MRAWLLLAVFWIGGGPPAGAQDQPLTVRVVACEGRAPAVPLSPTFEHLRAEISPRELRLTSDEAALSIEACLPGEVVLRSATSEQRVMLDDVRPALRPRVLALALAELSLALVGGAAAEPRSGPPDEETPSPSDAALTEAPSATPAPPLDEVDAPADTEDLFDGQLRAQSTQSARNLERRFAAGAEGRLFMAPASLHIGPRATLQLPRLEVSLLSLFGRRTHSLGELRTGVAAVALQVPAFRTLAGGAELSLSVGSELGFSWGSGTPESAARTRGDTRFAPFVAVPVRLSWGGEPKRGAYLRVELALGYAYGLAATVDGATVATTHGAFATLGALIGTRALPL